MARRFKNFIAVTAAAAMAALTAATAAPLPVMAAESETIQIEAEAETSAAGTEETAREEAAEDTAEGSAPEASQEEAAEGAAEGSASETAQGEAAEGAAEGGASETAQGEGADNAAEGSVPESEEASRIAWPAEPDIPSTAACLMDARNGVILYGKAMDEKRYPASITKVMTALLALENCNLDDEVTMDETGVAYAVSGSSNLYTVVGEVFTVRELVYGALMYSANDMATQLGKHVGHGSMDTCIQMMNDRAAELGCTGTHFNNACGMPDEEHYTTAHDMALIMQAAISNEDFCAVVGKTNYTISASNIYAARDISSHNLLLVHPDFLYPGIIGGKSGYTDAAGYTLVNAASRDDMTLVVCTMKAPDFATSGLDNVKVLNYGYDNFEEIRAIPEDQVVSGGVLTVPKGVTAEACDVIVEKMEAEGQACEHWTYTYLDHYVGDAVVTEETAGLLRGETSEPVEGETEAADASAGEADEGAAEEADEASVEEAPEETDEVTSGEAAGKSTSDNTETDPEGTNMVANTGAFPTILPDEEAHASVDRKEMDAQFERIGKTIIGISLGFILIFIIFLIGSFVRAARNRD